MHHRSPVRFLPLAALLQFAACHDEDPAPPAEAPELVQLGQLVFRHDTFGNEGTWTDELRMHEVVESLSPASALALGIKVDGAAVPPAVLANADLQDPATTVALLGLDAVIGLVADVQDGRVRSLGITCALCHSTVDDAFAPGIGNRLDGWANTDLDVGRILAASPAMQDPATQAVLLSWGAGKYDARFNQDGQNDPAVIPPAYGLREVPLASYTGDGDIGYWNAYVAVTQMGGRGVFRDPRIGVDIAHSPDLVTSKLPALRAYQHSVPVPPAPAGSFDPALADAGRALFFGKARCATCHAGPAFSTSELLPPSATGTDPRHAARSATKAYRVTPLRALWQHPPYFHDGSAATLADVVGHYDAHLHLGLTPAERASLAEFLASL